MVKAESVDEILWAYIEIQSFLMGGIKKKGVKSWSLEKLSPVPADSNEKEQLFPGLHTELSYMFALAYVPVPLHTVC